MSTAEMMEKLMDTDVNTAYQALKELAAASEKSDVVYGYMNIFSKMIFHKNSYIRTRGLILIAANAKWDTDNIIDEIIDEYLKHILDPKPITSRQCIKSLPQIAKYKPGLKEDIIIALEKADTSIYPDTMQPLVYKDITAALKEIKEQIP